MTIEEMFIAGAVFGLFTGGFVPNGKIGCAVLWLVPLAMIAYVYEWQSAHPESLRSTSGLDFVFGPLWPSLGAMVGFLAGRALRYAISEKLNRD